ncbi:MAG: PA0069 family radical SAM protein [Gammaproteobacteria bacterium]|nr:PA0069 family radical SAM protein [Gammaproteobacteria bacterium]
MSTPETGRRKGRGALSNPDGRYEPTEHRREDDGWYREAGPAPVATTLTPDRARSVITRNDSPDVPFDRSINPYRGCEHGCVYCFARPGHAYLGLSPGLDFETRLFYKQDAAKRLREELSHPGYRCSPIALGINTDAYQPAERRLGVTRELLEVLTECHHPVSIVTKSALIERDLDLLSELAGHRLVQVMVSVTTLDNRLASRMEPRASAPHRRLQVLRRLSAAGVPVGVLVAPLIPAVNDAELERILDACRDTGAQTAGYVVLRLPHELKQLFREWLEAYLPDRARHVTNLVRQLHGGKDYDPTFARRMRGQGPIADILAQRFDLASRRLGYRSEALELDCTRFHPPGHGGQLSLF